MNSIDLFGPQDFNLYLGPQKLIEEKTIEFLNISIQEKNLEKTLIYLFTPKESNAKILNIFLTSHLKDRQKCSICFLKNQKCNFSNDDLFHLNRGKEWEYLSVDKNIETAINAFFQSENIQEKLNTLYNNYIPSHRKFIENAISYSVKKSKKCYDCEKERNCNNKSDYLHLIMSWGGVDRENNNLKKQLKHLGENLSEKDLIIKMLKFEIETLKKKIYN